MSNATRSGRLGVAALLPADGPPGQTAPDVLIRGFGPGGRELAAYLAGLTGKWAELDRPGVPDLRLIVRRAGSCRPGRGAAIRSAAS